MKINFSLNPITKKRIQRFKSIKRAYWSFWILTITYTISLFANFYCSNEPILMQFNDRYYYPIFFNYYKNQFDVKENNTPVDYKELKESQLFLENKNNFMIFPPIPYGPTENIPIKQLIFLEALR
jgi:microcin C transport system permease protein